MVSPRYGIGNRYLLLYHALRNWQAAIPLFFPRKEKVNGLFTKIRLTGGSGVPFAGKADATSMAWRMALSTLLGVVWNVLATWGYNTFVMALMTSMSFTAMIHRHVHGVNALVFIKLPLYIAKTGNQCKYHVYLFRFHV